MKNKKVLFWIIGGLRILSALLISMLILSGCGNLSQPDKNVAWEEPVSVEVSEYIEEAQNDTGKHRLNMTIIRDDVSEYGLSVKFVNSSNEIIYFTSDIYSIQKMVSGEWTSLNTDDIETTTIATEQELGCSEEITININWKQKYGRLGGGEYRLVFPLNDESDTFELYDRFIIE